MTRDLTQEIGAELAGEWKTAAEWAAESLSTLPNTERSIRNIAKRHNWRDLGPGFARKRKGRGGGWEYHLSCLPDTAQAEFRRRVAVVNAQDRVEIKARADAKQVLELPRDLPARRHRVMEARAEVLREIERRMLVEGLTQSKAIMALVAEAKLDLSADNAVKVLEPALLKACVDANDRGRGLSRSQVFAWKKAYREHGIAGVIPRATRVAAAIEDT